MGKCFIKVRIHCLLYLNLAFFYELCDFPQIVRSDAIIEVNCAKSHHRVISDGLTNASCISGILVIPSIHTPSPPPIPFHQSLYRQIGLDGCTLTSCMTKIYRIHTVQVSAGKLEAGFLEALLCMLHFLCVDVIAISKTNLSMDYQQYMYMELTKYLIVQFTCMKDWEHQKILLRSH